MKKHLFIVGLWAACCALPNMLHAQWSYYYMCGLSSNMQKRGGFPTKSACEAAARAVFPCKGVTVGEDNNRCQGTDLPVSTAENTGQTLPGTADFDKIQQITGTVPTNPYDELIDGKEEYLYWEEAMFGETGGNNEMSFPVTNDAAYNEALQQVYSKETKWKGGRPGSAEGIFNYLNNASGNNDNVGESQRNADEKSRQGGRPGAMGGFTI
jgi:hypothetical protein